MDGDFLGLERGIKDAFHSVPPESKLREMIADDTFAHTEKVHDWRNHVPAVVEDWLWPQMTPRERLLCAIICQHAANKEEWD